MRRELPESVVVDHQWFLANLGHATMGNGYCHITVASRSGVWSPAIFVVDYCQVSGVSVHMLRNV